MADQIALKNYFGDVIQVDGKCWQFVGIDDRQPTHTSGDVSALFATCEDCLGGIDPVDPPTGFSQSMGDCHYIYGDPDTIAVDPTSASLNVDDNSSDNEIVWWTHTEGGVEYVIKYTQQDFAFTAGGKSIDQVVVSASDGSVNDTYTLTDPQSATRRNGLPWINDGVSGLGTAMSYNVTERIIPPEDCCSILGDYFALFNLNVQPTSGFSNVDEYGGALWYIWKKAETFASTPINTASSAGMDGIGLFLSGLDGYTSRSQFETTPSSVREAYNGTDVTAIFDRLKELSTIDGYWNADWDPLAQDPLDCPMLDCGTPNADPTLFVTVSWTDAASTKNLYGCTWCNGETKNVYSISFNQVYGNTNMTCYGTMGLRFQTTWSRNANQLYLKHDRCDGCAPNYGDLYRRDVVVAFTGGNKVDVYKSYWGSCAFVGPYTFTGSNNVGATGFSGAGLNTAGPNKLVSDTSMFGTATAGTITVQWQLGNSWS